MKINSNKGFTLIEMLVVVLIIGILAGIALPQYKMAVTKAKVASILPLMRRWKDALMEWKLQHGSYCVVEDGNNCSQTPTADELGVQWPSDWECSTGGVECYNDYWYCFPNEESSGYAYCRHDTSDGWVFDINMYQPDDQWFEDFRGMTTCYANGAEGHKICKALGGKLIPGHSDDYRLY